MREIKPNQAGQTVSNLTGDAHYLSFKPQPLPPKITLMPDVLTSLIQAHEKLAALNSVATRIPNANLFTAMYVEKEALMSSQIEGTEATLEDVLDVASCRDNQDVEEVVSYVDALNFAIKELESLPLCNRLLKLTHQKLMSNTRGQEKTPGEFRYSQNWIGGRGADLKSAAYVPPNPEDMKNALEDLEKYMNSPQPDVLIQAGYLHYQFETIHPFLDGNGRLGRMLVTLFFLEKNILDEPVLYLSYFLKRHQREYYDLLTEVRETGVFEKWLIFFLDAISACAQDALQLIDDLIDLHDINYARILEQPRHTSLLKVFEYTEKKPIIEIGKTAKDAGLSFKAVAKAVVKLCDLKILEEVTEQKRNKKYIYRAYLDLLKKGT